MKGNRIAVLAAALAIAGPFDGLHVIDGVNTSRDGRWISAGISTENYRAEVPGYDEPVTSAMGSDHRWIFLSVDCRAGPDSEFFPAQPARAEIAIPDHPDQKPHNWWSPMYWILESSGKAVEKVAVTVTLADADDPDTIWHSEPATLERYRTDYSAIRTLLSVWIDGPAVLDILAEGRGIAVSVRGESVDVRGMFEAAPQLKEAVSRMRRDCPKAK